MRRLRHSLLIAVSTALALGVASIAQAQVPEQPGFYAGASGLWRWNWGDHVNPGAGLNARPRSGPGFSGVVGYKMESPWDIALGGGAQWHRNVFSTVGGARLDTSSRYQYVDLEAGYSMTMGKDTAIRVFGGVRGLHFNQDAVAPAIGLQAHRNVWGVGPRIGISGQTFFTENIGVVGSVDGSLIAASFSEVGTASGSGYWRLVPVVGGEVGVQYRFADTPSLAITGGVRIDALFNASFSGGGGGGGAVSAGPFMRLTYNLSAPRGVAPAPAPAPVARPQLHGVLRLRPRRRHRHCGHHHPPGRQRRQDRQRHAAERHRPRRPLGWRRLQHGAVAAPRQRGQRCIGARRHPGRPDRRPRPW